MTDNVSLAGHRQQVLDHFRAVATTLTQPLKQIHDYQKLYSVVNNHPQAIQLWLSGLDGDINGVVWNEYNALCMALDSGDLTVVSRVMEAGADLFHRDANGNTIMHNIIRRSVNFTQSDEVFTAQLELIGGLGGGVCAVVHNHAGAMPLDMLVDSSRYPFSRRTLAETEKRVFEAYRVHVESVIPIKPLVAIVMAYVTG